MPDFQRFYQFANMLKGYALALGVAVAIGFVWAWWVHRQREHAEERSARSRAAFQRHLHQALLHPELAEPVLGGPAEMVRYKLFVANLLAIADEILILSPTAAWHDSERVIAGIVVGCLVSLPLWAGLGWLLTAYLQ